MSHTYEWVTHMNESHSWMSHTHERVARIDDSHIWMNHIYEKVTLLNEFRHSVRISCVTNTNKSYHSYEHTASHNSTWCMRSSSELHKSLHVTWIILQILMCDVTHRTNPYVWHNSEHRSTWCMRRSVEWRLRCARAAREHGQQDKRAPSCNTYERILSRVWMSRVTHMKESCHVYEWVVSHIWMISVMHTNESCHTRMSRVTHEWVVSHTNESCHTRTWITLHVSDSNESCHAYAVQKQRGSTGSQMNARHDVKYMNGSCHAYECVVSHISMSLVTHTNMPHM